MKNRKICIFGGLGFFGRNLTEMLDESNHITVVDIGERPEFLSDSINYLNMTTESHKIYGHHQFEYIFYLVGNTSIARSVSDPVFDLENNTIQLLKLLESVKNEKPKLIYPSSAACYGEMKNPLTALKNEPMSPYGISKLFSENYLRYFHMNYGVPVLICRFFSLFGEYNNKQVIYDSTLRLLEHPDKLTIFNSNSQRDFIYIKEAIRAMFFLCDENQFNADVFNIGRGEAKSISHLTKEIQEILHIYPTIETENGQFTGDPQMQIANIDKLKKLGFNYDSSQISNLVKTIEWIKRTSKLK